MRRMRFEEEVSPAMPAYGIEIAKGFTGQVGSSEYAAKYNLNHPDKLAKYFNCSLAFFPEEPLQLHYQSLLAFYVLSPDLKDYSSVIIIATTMP